jgi:flagellum-specific ATP synthase
MSDIVDKEHKRVANELKKHMAVYANSEDLINIGAYVKGSSGEIDSAIEKHAGINNFLTQSVDEKFSFEESVSFMKEIVG